MNGLTIMTSDKQLVANRRNAKNSTGPKTDKGKAVSKYNALRHVLSTPSYEARFLTREESDDFELFIPRELDEWLHAQCAVLSSTEREIRTKLWPKMQRGALTEVEQMVFDEIMNKQA